MAGEKRIEVRSSVVAHTQNPRWLRGLKWCAIMGPRDRVTRTRVTKIRTAPSNQCSPFTMCIPGTELQVRLTGRQKLYPLLSSWTLLLDFIRTFVYNMRG